MESIARAKVDQLSQPQLGQHMYMLMLMKMDMGRHACSILTQNVSTLPLFAFTPHHKEMYKMPPTFGSMLKGKLEVITKIEERLSFS